MMGHLGLEDVYKRARGLYGSFSRPVEKPAHVDPDGVVGPAREALTMTSTCLPRSVIVGAQSVEAEAEPNHRVYQWHQMTS